MPKSRPKPLGPVGQRLAAAVFRLDAVAHIADVLVDHGQCCPHLAGMIREAAKENHAAALDVCESQGYEVPTNPTPQFGQK